MTTNNNETTRNANERIRNGLPTCWGVDERVYVVLCSRCGGAMDPIVGCGNPGPANGWCQQGMGITIVRRACHEGACEQDAKHDETCENWKGKQEM